MAELNLLYNDHSLSRDGSAWIVLEGGFSRHENGLIQLTPECATVDELNHCIDGLVSTLERARRQGKIAFEKAQKRPPRSPFTKSN